MTECRERADRRGPGFLAQVERFPHSHDLQKEDPKAALSTSPVRSLRSQSLGSPRKAGDEEGEVSREPLPSHWAGLSFRTARLPVASVRVTSKGFFKASFLHSSWQVVGAPPGNHPQALPGGGGPNSCSESSRFLPMLPNSTSQGRQTPQDGEPAAFPAA